MQCSLAASVSISVGELMNLNESSLLDLMLRLLLTIFQNSKHLSPPGGCVDTNEQQCTPKAGIWKIIFYTFATFVPRHTAQCASLPFLERQECDTGRGNFEMSRNFCDNKPGD